MKLFNTVQELWDYSLLCPICDKEREMFVDIGPDFSFEVNSFEKIAHYLILDCSFSNRLTAYQMKYKINCIGNTYEAIIENSTPITDRRSQSDSESALRAYFYLYIQSFCRQCNSSIYSMDLEPDTSAGTLSNISLERESYFLLKTEDKFHVTFIHDSNTMLVSKFYDNNGCCVESEKHIELPLVKIDLIDQAKAAHRLKTLILFS